MSKKESSPLPDEDILTELYAHYRRKAKRSTLHTLDHKTANEVLSFASWISFGKKEFFCPGKTPVQLEHYKALGELPPYCRDCYKPILHFDSFFESNIENFFSMSREFGLVLGKFDKKDAVFYFRERYAAEEFGEKLEGLIKRYHVAGRIKLVRACKLYRELRPEWWEDALEFVGPKDGQMKMDF